MTSVRNAALLCALLATVVVGALGAAPAAAQQEANVGQLVAGLINVNVGAIQVDDVVVVDVENVLNNNEIRILNNVLNNNEILSRNQDFLNNLLRDANIITDNQVVVGILSGGQIVVQDVQDV